MTTEARHRLAEIFKMEETKKAISTVRQSFVAKATDRHETVEGRDEALRVIWALDYLATHIASGEDFKAEGNER